MGLAASTENSERILECCGTREKRGDAHGHGPLAHKTEFQKEEEECPADRGDGRRVRWDAGRPRDDCDCFQIYSWYNKMTRQSERRTTPDARARQDKKRSP